jgi:hypothetical protein
MEMAMAAATGRSLRLLQQAVGGEDWGRDDAEHGSYGGDDEDEDGGPAPS